MIPPDSRRVLDFAIEAARLLADRHCEDVRRLDVRGLSQVSDYLLIASGTSYRQLRSLAHALSDLGDERDNAVFRSNSDAASTWIVVDFVDLVAHLFEPEVRAHYDLEGLWSDAAVVPYRETQKRGNAETQKRGDHR